MNAPQPSLLLEHQQIAQQHGPCVDAAVRWDRAELPEVLAVALAHEPAADIRGDDDGGLGQCLVALVCPEALW